MSMPDTPDDEYDGPTIEDLAALYAEHNDDEPPKRRNTIIARTVHEALLAADAQGLEPWMSENGRWLGLKCPLCRSLGRESNATIEHDPAGFLKASCATCYDDVEPGILETLGAVRITSNVVPISPELNGHATTPPSVRHHVELLDLDQLLANPPPDPDFAWGNTVGGYLERGTLCVLHGDGGLGKSLIGQGLCRRYTLGKEWLGQTTEGGVALYLDGENSLAEIARRLYSFEFRPGEQRLKYGRVQFPILLNPDAGEKLMDELIEDTGATLIVLDSQRALWGGDEREQLEVRPMYAMLARVAERHQVAILLIHHDNKSLLYSGSTDINAAVVSRIHLERFDPKKREDRRRILWHEKSRSGPEQEPVIFTVDKTHDGLLTFQILDNDTQTKSTTAQPGAEPRHIMRKRIEELLEDRVPRTRPEVARELGIDPTSGTLRRAWDDMHDEQALMSSDNQHWTLKSLST